MRMLVIQHRVAKPAPENSIKGVGLSRSEIK